MGSLRLAQPAWLSQPLLAVPTPGLHCWPGLALCCRGQNCRQEQGQQELSCRRQHRCQQRPGCRAGGLQALHYRHCRPGWLPRAGSCGRQVAPEGGPRNKGCRASMSISPGAANSPGTARSRAFQPSARLLWRGGSSAPTTAHPARPRPGAAQQGPVLVPGLSAHPTHRQFVKQPLRARHSRSQLRRGLQGAQATAGVRAGGLADQASHHGRPR